MNAEFAKRAQRPQRAQRCGGAVKSQAFTLIETLAAVALLGLIGSVVVVGLAGAGERARMGDAVAMIRDLDQRAREVAVNEGPVMLLIDSEQRRVRVVSAERDDPTLAERWLPDAVELALQDARGRDLDAINFDRLGHCHDYVARIGAGDGSLALSISGLTGWMEESP